MARTDATGFHSPATKDLQLGDHNSVTLVPASTVIDFTGSRATGTGFIPQTVTTVTCSLAGGGEIRGAALIAKTFYPFGLDRVVTGTTGIVYVLHR
tara:strand:+ start:223 stop:510 length:288 start_codon:yes stop_codon:yes gene_type:complete